MDTMSIWLSGSVLLNVALIVLVWIVLESRAAWKGEARAWRDEVEVMKRRQEEHQARANGSIDLWSALGSVVVLLIVAIVVL